MPDDLGKMPEPTTEEPQHSPGGIDATAQPKYGKTPGPPTVPDVNPDANPAVDDSVPDEITQPDDKSQEPDEKSQESDDGSDAEPEAPA